MLIYLHIPFCDSKCHYCAFNSYVDKFDLKSSYMQACVKQLIYELSIFKPKPNSIKSFFIGGGTPSTVNPELYLEFFKIILPYLKKDAEITSEANPNSATKKWLSGIKKLGVNRISFGVQSFSEKKLKFLGRNHSKLQAIKAINYANEVGFKNISLDFIYGTKMDTKKLLQDDLKIAKSLPINHISAYSLTIEKDTPFAKTPQVAIDSIELAKDFTNDIQNKGFQQYEISNFGTCNSIHNLGYWEGDNYMGIGSGAVGFLKNRRFYPSKIIEDFISSPLKRDIENLSKDDLHVEKIFLGLRSKIGVRIDNFSKKEMENINILLQNGKLKSNNNMIYNTDYFLSDEISLFITG